MDENSNVGASQISFDAPTTPPKKLSSAVNAQIYAAANTARGSYRPSIDVSPPGFRPSISITARCRPSMMPGFLPGGTAFGGAKQNVIKPSYFLPTGTILAKNAYCETSLVSEKSTQNLLVMKRISRKFLGKRKMREAFDAEVEALLRLDHPHLIRLLHRLDDPEYVYLVSEYAAKGNFLNFLRERRRVSEEEAFAAFVACCFALNHLLQNEVPVRVLNLEKLHRSGEQVKLTTFSFQDFLQSHDEEEVPGEGREEDLGEGEEGKEAGGEKAVLLKLGKLLLELVSGRASIHAGSQRSAFENMRNTPHFQRLNLSDACKELLELLLSPEPNAITCIADVLKSEWAGAMSRPVAPPDPFGLVQFAQSSRSIGSMGQIPHASIAQVLPRGSYLAAPPENVMGFARFMGGPSAHDGTSAFKASDNKSTDRKNYWRKKKSPRDTPNVSMASSRFFERNQELEKSKAERIQGFRAIEKTFLEKIAEVFGCTTR